MKNVLLTTLGLTVLAIMAVMLVSSHSQQSQKKADIAQIHECTLLTHDSVRLRFPSEVLARRQGVVSVIGFIYTHCPGVCVTITETMKRSSYLLSQGKAEGQNVQFVALTFDPERDTPSALREYGNLHHLTDEMKSGHWQFLTGDEATVDSLMQHYNIETRQTYTTINEASERVYFIDHTDRIALLDWRGKVLKEYEGSSVEPETIAADVQRFSSEASRSLAGR
jgi:protein SCO1/2